jgi:predicted alpha/beta superfamily hydrolase
MKLPPQPPPAFLLRSPQTGTDYHLYLEVPAAHEPGPWPAVLFLDGDDQFRFAVAAYRAMREAGRVPPLLLAGIGYGASYTKPANRRLRDYTPTAMATEAGSGAADPFVAFLGDTLWPELARRFPLRGDVRGLAGHSLGSLLVLHALFQRKPFFNRLLASAPSLWWDNRALLCQAQQLQAAGVSLPARVFLSVGEQDTPSMTGDLELLEDQLAAQPFDGLEVIRRRFPGRDHYNVLPDAFGEGLATLFSGVV